MRVFFDVTCLMPKRISGIGVYARELYKALKLESVKVTPVYKLSRILKTSFIQDHIGIKGRPCLGRLESVLGKAIIQGPDFRLLTNSNKFFKVVTIHDLAVFHDGFNDTKFRENGQQATRRVLEWGQPDVVVADTENIANEIREFFPKFSERVVCVPPGADHFSNAELFADRTDSSERFFLYAGHLEARKNVMGIIKAFELLISRKIDARLVLVGKDGFQGDAIRNYIASSFARNSIEIRGYVEEFELKKLYRNASGFVFPSFYEGFGFPILEAMSLGCPVITSDYGAMSEVAGAAALLVDPNNIESIANAMDRLLQEPSLAETLQNAGRIQIQRYTWKKCAQSFLDIYNNA